MSTLRKSAAVNDHCTVLAAEEERAQVWLRVRLRLRILDPTILADPDAQIHRQRLIAQVLQRDDLTGRL